MTITRDFVAICSQIFSCGKIAQIFLIPRQEWRNVRELPGARVPDRQDDEISETRWFCGFSLEVLHATCKDVVFAMYIYKGKYNILCKYSH